MTTLLDLLRYHFLVWLPPTPQGDLAEADFICPQAFGRNTWTDKEMPGAMAKLRQEVGSDLNLEQDAALRKLLKIGFDPGSVNVSLAKGCHYFAKKMEELGKKPWVIGQWEVIFALATANKEMAAWYTKNREYVIAIWPSTSAEYLGTKGLLHEAFVIAYKNYLYRPIVIAHREHLWRCALLAKVFFSEANIVIPAKLFPSDREPRFDPKSKQWQTCSGACWRPYEIMTRIHHMMQGWTP